MERPNCEEAKQKILVCVRNDSATLDLSFLELTSLPPCFHLLPRVTSLNIGDNRLNNSSLVEVAELSGLQELFAGNNNLTDLSSIKGLVGLKYLEIGYNQIVSLQPISGLINLQKLIVNHNELHP